MMSWRGAGAPTHSNIPLPLVRSNVANTDANARTTRACTWLQTVKGQAWSLPSTMALSWMPLRRAALDSPSRCGSVLRPPCPATPPQVRWQWRGMRNPSWRSRRGTSSMTVRTLMTLKPTTGMTSPDVMAGGQRCGSRSVVLSWSFTWQLPMRQRRGRAASRQRRMRPPALPRYLKVLLQMRSQGWKRGARACTETPSTTWSSPRRGTGLRESTSLAMTPEQGAMPHPSQWSSGSSTMRSPCPLASKRDHICGRAGIASLWAALPAARHGVRVGGGLANCTWWPSTSTPSRQTKCDTTSRRALRPPHPRSRTWTRPCPRTRQQTSTSRRGAAPLTTLCLAPGRSLDWLSPHCPGAAASLPVRVLQPLTRPHLRSRAETCPS
mmetsp:Transcript_347/g.876  ORF Transcript_347/g.876 Transcript_347/m.876 type:complete len:381 (+) Transcript_347:174-1316(+)